MGGRRHHHQCYSNPPALNPNSGGGHVQLFGGLNTYISGSPHSKAAVVLITDIFGYDSPILRDVADKVGGAGFFVVVPDFLKGDPYVPDDPNRTFLAWLQDHTPEKSFDDGKAIIEALKSKGFSSIGAAGFCWGAKVVVDLSKVELIDVAVLLHPSYVTLNDIKEVKTPILILGAEFDEVSPPALLKQFQEVLSANLQVDGCVKIFPKVSHGWSLRYDAEDKEAVKQADEAHKDMLAWFIKYFM